MTDMTSRYGVTMRAVRRMHNGANVMTLDSWQGTHVAGTIVARTSLSTMTPHP